jgi:hypothetical protein
MEFTPAELSAMLDDFVTLCELTHPEKKNRADGTTPGAQTTLTAVPDDSGAGADQALAGAS